MEAIRTYIDNVFKAFEPTERVATLKRDMLGSLEEKYLELKASGKSENEAVGTVIADFGNIDEIAAEIGIKTVGDAHPGVPNNALAVLQSEPENILPVSREDAYDFINQFKKSSIWIGIGVWAIMAGVALFFLLSDYGGFALLTLLTFIAAAIPLFIVYGMALSRFEVFEEKAIVLDDLTRAQLETERKAYSRKFAVYISVGVMIILVAVGIFLLLTSSYPELTIQALALMMFMIGSAIFLFINTSMTFGSYQIILEEGEHARKYKDIVNNALNNASKSKDNDSERIIATVAAVFWPTMTAVYLFWSFVWSAWHVSWLIWPIAGILFGAFAGGISVWNEGKK